MKKEENALSVSTLDKLHTDGAGYDILRYISLPDLLGDESHTLLYFMGKNLARTLELESLDEIFYTFDKLGWGQLDLVKERKKSFTFHLMSDAIVYRLNAPFKTEFRLEAGFLAEAFQLIHRTECECVEKINRRIHQVELKVVLTT